MKSVLTAILMKDYTKRAIERVAAADSIPQAVLVRQAIVRGARLDPSLRAARLLVEKGWQANSIDFGGVSGGFQVTIPWLVSEQYGILASLDNTTKADLFREMVLRYGPPEIQATQRNTFLEEMERMLGKDSVEEFSAAVQYAREGITDADVKRGRYMEILTNLVNKLSTEPVPAPIEEEQTDE